MSYVPSNTVIHNPVVVDDSVGDDWEELAAQKHERIHGEMSYMEADQKEFELQEEMAHKAGAGCVKDVLDMQERFPVYLQSCSDLKDWRQAYPGSRVNVYSEADHSSFIGSALFVASKGVKLDKYLLEGDCFSVLCNDLGLSTDVDWTSPSNAPKEVVDAARAMTRTYVVVRRRLGLLSHPQNHVVLIGKGLSGSADTVGLDKAKGMVPLQTKVITVAQLFDCDTMEFYTNYFSNTGLEGVEELQGFGSLRGDQTQQRRPPPPASSVADEAVGGGSSNISGGVVRRARRKLNPVPTPSYAGTGVARNYNVVSAVLFNNMQEMTLDAISNDYAQEILEEVFQAWGLPFDNPTIMKYAEDLVFTFLIATTASDKADYNRSYDLPAAPGSGELLADFKLLTDTIVIGHRLTRRQFIRGLADRLRKFVRADENAVLQASIADRAGCQYQYGDLCFDGSTHCAGLNPSERAFVRTLEARNLFESDAVLATGASDKLLTGFNQRQAPRITAA